ncbi:hypothetical protein OAT67_06060 [Bacteriovoracaceae bacterium]|nr:hypothetical protein [Bacteriovoracaceae bacterium]
MKKICLVLTALTATSYAQNTKIVKFHKVISKNGDILIISNQNIRNMPINPYEEELSDEVKKIIKSKKSKIVDFSDLGHQPPNREVFSDD